MVSFGLAACGPIDGEGFAEDDARHVAQVQEPAFATTPRDRQAAAVVARVVNGNTELWVFACGADHVMRQRVQSATGRWGDWSAVPGNWPCYSAPSVGKWVGGTPQETIGLYYRGGTNQKRLVEVWYASDGSTAATDLSVQGGFGDIAGNPAVVDAVDKPGMSQRMAVAVKRASNNEVFTFDLYQGSWHIQSAGMKAEGNDFGVSYRQYSKNYFSAQENGGTSWILSRTTWTQGYSRIGKFINTLGPEWTGVVNFGRPSSACTAAGCALVRRELDSSLRWGQPWLSGGSSGIVPFTNSVTGSAYSAPTGDNRNALIGFGSGGLARINFSTGAVQFIQTADVYSAGSLVVNGENSGPTAAAVYISRNTNDPATARRLMFIRLDDIGGAGRQDLQYPGNVLVQ